MKKIILTLYVCLSCIMIANARWNPSVVDTLPKRVINGLEVILIRETYESGNIFWTLRVSDFKNVFNGLRVNIRVELITILILKK